MAKVRHALDFTPHPANVEAERAAKLAKGKPSEHDAPPIRPFPGKPIEPPPGQLSIFDRGE